MLTITIPAKLEREFKARAKAAYPRETFAYVLGTVVGDAIYMEELWWPDDLDRHCTEYEISIQPHWMVEAIEDAAEDGRTVVGDCHSHCYTMRDTGGRIRDRSQSEADIDCAAGTTVAGICTVQAVRRAGKMVRRASLRWWGPTVPVKVVVE